VSGSGISWDICKSAPHSRQINTPAPHHSIFYRPDALPAAQPTASKHWRQNNHYANVPNSIWHICNDDGLKPIHIATKLNWTELALNMPNQKFWIANQPSIIGNLTVITSTTCEDKYVFYYSPLISTLSPNNFLLQIKPKHTHTLSFCTINLLFYSYSMLKLSL